LGLGRSNLSPPPPAMGAATGGSHHLQTGFHPSPPTTSSTPPPAGPTTARLLALFKECVDSGIWASLETVTRQGVINVDFCCSIPAAVQPRARQKKKQRPRNAARTRQWRETRQQHRTQHSPATAQVTSALPVAQPATVNGPATSASPTAALSFAAVAAQPAQEVVATPTPSATPTPAAASSRQPKAKGMHPVKCAKNTLAASRVSQRAAILSKKRAATAVTATPPPMNPVVEEDAPELLRGSDGVAGLDLSLDLSSTPPPPPRPPMSPPAGEGDDSILKESEEGAPTPSTPPPMAKFCDCTSDCEEDDFHNEEVIDGRRLNTIKPPWVAVFPKRGDLCRFCRKMLPYGNLEKEECEEPFSRFPGILTQKYFHGKLPGKR